jgi:hypothetical protein
LRPSEPKTTSQFGGTKTENGIGILLPPLFSSPYKNLKGNINVLLVSSDFFDLFTLGLTFVSSFIKTCTKYKCKLKVQAY